MSVPIDLRLSNVAPPLPEPPKTVYGDLVNIPDPIKLNQNVSIYNYDDVALYMKVDGYATGWTFTTNNLGSLGSGANMTRYLDRFGSRAKPGAETTETVTFRLRAYTDSGYTNLKWTFERVVTIILIKSDDGSWTQDFYDNFDDGTVMGWAVANESNNGAGYPKIQVRTDYALSLPNSIRQVCQYTSSAWNCTAKKEIWKRRGADTIIYLGWWDASDTDRVPINRWLRLVIPLPRSQTIEIQIADQGAFYYVVNPHAAVRGRLYKSFTTPDKNKIYAIVDVRSGRSGNESYLWMDDFRIVSKN